MKKTLSKLIIVAAAMLIVSCKSAVPIYNSNEISFEKPVTNTVALEEAIIKAGKDTNWRISKESAGKMKGMINVNNKHSAVIRITYDPQAFSIRHVSNIDLKYDEKRQFIHPNYNNWIKSLEHAIVAEASSITEPVATQSVPVVKSVPVKKK